MGGHAPAAGAGRRPRSAARGAARFRGVRPVERGGAIRWLRHRDSLRRAEAYERLDRREEQRQDEAIGVHPRRTSNWLLPAGPSLGAKGIEFLGLVGVLGLRVSERG